MIKLLKWFYYLSKRLYKKPTFIALILLIPLSVAAFSLVANEKAGFVRIAVVNCDNSGIGAKITDELVNGSKAVNFTEYADLDAALADLDKETLDAVWVLADGLPGKIKEFADDLSGENSIAQVYMKENNLGARLPLEKLSAAIYPYASKRLYYKFLRENPAADLSKLSDSDIHAYYKEYVTGGNLFTFSFPNGGNANVNEANYLVSPVRGILSVITVICGMASAMFYISDEKRGAFARARASGRVLISFGSQFTAVMNIGVFALAAIFILGVNAPALREIAIFFVFVINVSLFCTVLAELIKNLALFASVATLLTVLQMLLCPVFFDYGIQKIPQLLFPNTYYINSVHSDLYLKYSFVYMAVAAALMGLIYLKKRKA
ncbi:MAG: ABC transporter permease [Clostridia bacterium]|nr:ABC transporter permease [Clostridia bacterium]